MSSRIQFRRDTAARWKEINPILLEGELGLESDTLNAKIGDGVHAWKELDYGKVIDNIATSPGGSDNLTLSQKAITELCKGTSTYSNAAEYPQLKIADFSTGITTTGENRRTEILTAFNKWLDGIEFKITSDASKYHGCCKISCDGRNGEVNVLYKQCRLPSFKGSFCSKLQRQEKSCLWRYIFGTHKKT